MTLRRQIVLGIVPIFTALALVANGVTYFLQRHATLEGLRLEAGAYAVAFSAFKHPGDWSRLESGNAAATAFPAALKKLERWAMLQRFVVWSAADRRIVFRYPAGTEVAPPPADAIQRFQAREPYVVSPLIRRENSAALAGYSPLHDVSGAITGIIGVEIDATSFSSEMTALQQQLVRNGLAILVIGGVVALIVSSLLEGELRRLTRAAAGIDAGEYVAPPAGRVAEVTDLANTFGVLAGSIAEVRARSHRAYAENDQFRTEEDLLALYRETFLPPQITERAGVRTCLAATADAAGVFFDAGPAGDQARLCFGRVAGPATIRTATLASAIGRELVDRLARGDGPAQALAGTAALFALESASVLTWHQDAVTGQRFDFAACETRTSEFSLPRPGESQLCHNLPSGDAEPLALYLRHYSGEPIARQLGDLAHLAGATNSVIVLLRSLTATS